MSKSTCRLPLIQDSQKNVYVYHDYYYECLFQFVTCECVHGYVCVIMSVYFDVHSLKLSIILFECISTFMPNDFACCYLKAI